jgi:hypothetical protein
MKTKIDLRKDQKWLDGLKYKLMQNDQNRNFARQFGNLLAVRDKLTATEQLLTYQNNDELICIVPGNPDYYRTMFTYLNLIQ